MIGIEAGDRLWQRLWARSGAEVYVFDGKKARRFSESLCSSGARDDRRSAEDILAMVQSEAHRKSANRVDFSATGGLEHLHRECDVCSAPRRGTTVREVNRHESRLRSLLQQFHPSVATLASKRLKAVSMLKLLAAAPTVSSWRELAQHERDQALSGLRSTTRDAFNLAMDEDWGAVDAAEERAVRSVLRRQVDALRHALQRHREAEGELAAVLDTDPLGQRTTRIPGVGNFLGAAMTIAAAQSDQGRDGAAIRLGAAPVTSRSGERGNDSPHVFMRRSAESAMRKSTYLLGLQLVRNHRWANAQYAFYRGRGIKTAAACRRIVRSFSRILHAIHRDGAEFDEARYIRALQQKGVPWAQGLEV